jgi:hypothetical protein
MEMPHYGYSGVGSPSPEWKDITDRCKSTVEELFTIAEEHYGDRVNRIPVSVFEAKCDGPQTFFGKAFADAKIRIQEIPENVNGNQRRYQLAQEIIHCLSPVPPNELTFFEKGLAQVFAHCPAVSVGIERTSNPKYAKARDLCESLERECGRDIVRGLRKKQPYISRIKPDLIIEVCPKFSSELAELLCKPWE